MRELRVPVGPNGPRAGVLLPRRARYLAERRLRLQRDDARAEDGIGPVKAPRALKCGAAMRARREVQGS